MNSEELHEKFGVTEAQLDAEAAEYESGDWSHMVFGDVIMGRPRLAEEKLDTMTVRIPHSRMLAIKSAAAQQGITQSQFVRTAIDNELMAV